MKIEKEKLSNFVEKFNLNGLVEAALLEVKDNQLTTVFKNPEGDLRGEVVLNEFKSDDMKIGAYSSTELKNHLGLFSGEINVEFDKRSDGQIMQINFSDEEDKADYACCNPTIIDADGKRSTVKAWDVKVTLTREILASILKKLPVIPGTPNVAFFEENGKLKLLINYKPGNNESKITTTIPVDEMDSDFELSTFSISLFKAVIETVSKRPFTEATLQISNKGIMYISVKDADVTANYWVARLKI